MGSHSVTCHPTEVTGIPSFTPAEAGTRLSDPGWMQGRVDLVGWLHAEMVCTLPKTSEVAMHYSDMWQDCQITFPHTRPCYAKSYRSVEPQTLHGNVHQVDHVPNGPTNSAAITTAFPLRLCGGKLLVTVTRQRRYGLSRRRVDDDDPKTVTNPGANRARRALTWFMRRTPPRRPSRAQQTWNWVIGSPGQWVIWVIFHVRVTRSSF